MPGVYLDIVDYAVELCLICFVIYNIQVGVEQPDLAFQKQIIFSFDQLRFHQLNVLFQLLGD